MKKIVVLISGEGTTLQAIIDACQRGHISNASIGAVFSNDPEAYGLQRANAANIATRVLLPADSLNRQDYDRTLAKAIDEYQPDVVVLAGFMRILSADFVQHFSGRLLNIHPSLLPKYPGLHTHRQALANGDKEHGTSVHFVTEQLDSGPVILQAKVPVFAQDSEEDLIARVKSQEQAIYPLVIGWFTQGRLTMRDNAAWLDNLCLPPQGYAAD